MVGIKKSKLILGIFIPILAFFLMSQNTFAVNVPNANIRRSYYHQSIGVTNNESVGSQSIPYTAIGYQQGVIKRLYGIVASTVPNDPYSDKYKTISVNFTITQENYIQHNNNSLHDTPFHYLYVTAGGQEYQIECSVYRWINNTLSGNSYTCNGYFSNYEKITAISVRAGIMNADLNTNPIGTVGCSSSAFMCDLGPIKLESFNYTINSSADPLIQGQETIINQNQTIINQNQEVIDQNNQAYDNISNQSSDNIGGSSNNQTTSLINVITGFIGAFSGINATNCNLTLEFPDYAGGSRIVNICSGKEKAPRIVEIGSSLLLICVFVPLAYVLIRMIYNEIRSWTNG